MTRIIKGVLATVLLSLSISSFPCVEAKELFDQIIVSPKNRNILEDFASRHLVEERELGATNSTKHSHPPPSSSHHHEDHSGDHGNDHEDHSGDGGGKSAGEGSASVGGGVGGGGGGGVSVSVATGSDNGTKVGSSVGGSSSSASGGSAAGGNNGDGTKRVGGKSDSGSGSSSFIGDGSGGDTKLVVGGGENKSSPGRQPIFLLLFGSAVGSLAIAAATHAGKKRKAEAPSHPLKGSVKARIAMFSRLADKQGASDDYRRSEGDVLGIQVV